jgi:uridine kinase
MASVNDPAAQLNLFSYPETHKIARVLKRDGRLVAFNKNKIVDAVFRAAQSVGGDDRQRAEELSNQVIADITRDVSIGTAPSVEEIQDRVEKILIENGHAKTAKAFILYRAERRAKRDRRETDASVEDNVPYKVLHRHLAWNADHDCHTVAGINRHLQRGTWNELILDAERAYHAEIDKVAGILLKRLPEMRLVIVAGPSSSGKTTTTTKISERLAKNGVKFVLLNLDNYFRNLSEQIRDEHGDYDFEMPAALDLDLINAHLGDLMDGKEVTPPFYNFKTGKREPGKTTVRLGAGDILLIDSLHGLTEEMTSSVAPETKFKFYIEALCQIEDADGEFVRFSDWRMIRRMVRDHWHRSYDPIQTIGHWHYVRRSEMRYIVPYIKNVDYIFNGALPYELPYHKRRLLPVLDALPGAFENQPKKTDALIRARRVHKLLSSVDMPDSDAAVPTDSLLREFIGGSRYSY